MVQQKEMRKRLDRELGELRAEIESMNQEVAALTRDVDDEGGAPRNHMADEGSNDYERERIMSVQREMDLRVQLIEAALQRLDDGSYGTCLRCGQPIPDDRLDAMPFAAYDIDCQEIVDRDGIMNDPKISEPLTTLPGAPAQ